MVGRPIDECALFHAHVERRRQLAKSDRDVQHVARRFADRFADAAPRRTRVRIEALSRDRRAAGDDAVLAQRRRDCVGHDRQRQLRGRNVLGIAQCRGRDRHPDDRLDLGRRIRHLRAERISDHEGESLRTAERISARPRRQANKATTSTPSRDGTIPRYAKRISPRRASCAWSMCRRSCT